MTKGPFYVSEADLYEDVTHFYNTDEFPLRLSNNILKMTKRIVGAKRFDGCSNLLREEMVSSAYCRVCCKLIERKFDLKRGSKVYSWVSRVIINDCLQVMQKEQKRIRGIRQYVNLFYNELPLSDYRQCQFGDN